MKIHLFTDQKEKNINARKKKFNGCILHKTSKRLLPLPQIGIPPDILPTFIVVQRPAFFLQRRKKKCEYFIVSSYFDCTYFHDVHTKNTFFAHIKTKIPDQHDAFLCPFISLFYYFTMMAFVFLRWKRWEWMGALLFEQFIL